ncbi:CRISPR-associated protein [Tepidibacillus infernus]|uniref:CRISPR-associated protein n=1 Tax=Tepidibacillus infernus TaxID=1806172 RepID=UPI003B71B893
MVVKQNSDFIFAFEAVMTNPNGDPDQENKPRMDYETSTVLVSDARRKRDIRDFLKEKGFPIFVDTLADKKVPMDKMFEEVYNQWLGDQTQLDELLDGDDQLAQLWKELELDGIKTYAELSEKIKKDKKKKELISDVNNLFLTQIIKKSLIDIRLFGSAMAVGDVTRTYTGSVQITWGYSLHPAELVKSNTITSIMNDDSSTFGKKHKLYYALVAHYGTVNKFSARNTGMTEEDRDLFRKSLVQGMMANQTDSKQGQAPLFYLEVIYNPNFDGYLGDLRRFLKVSEQYEQKAIRSLQDLYVDFHELTKVIDEMKVRGYIDQVIGWFHPYANKEHLLNIPEYEVVDLWAPVTN